LAELMARNDLLEGAALEPPQISRLFNRLRDMGYDAKGTPVTLDQGVAEAVRFVDSEREKGRARKG